MPIIRGTTPISKYLLRIMFNRNTGQATQWLECKASVASESQVPVVHLFFGPTGKGGFRAGSGNIVYYITDRESFFAVYHMLQTEKPVLVHWIVDPDNDNRINDLQVATDDEPVGEFDPSNL